MFVRMPWPSCRPSTDRRHLGRIEHNQTRAEKENPRSKEGPEGDKSEHARKKRAEREGATTSWT